VIALLVALCLSQDAVILRTAESPPRHRLGEAEIGVWLGGRSEQAEAAGFWRAPFTRGRIAFIADPKEAEGARADLVVWVAPGTAEEAAAVLREAKGIGLCIVSGKGSADPEPLRIGEAWLVRAPGPGGLWGRIEVRAGGVVNRFAPPDGKPAGADPVDALRGSVKAEAAPPPALETSNRACILRIHGMTERASYGGRTPAAGLKFLVLDASFENTIPLTLVQSNQVPTQYKVKELGDHLYVVADGRRTARLLRDGAQLPGHLPTSNFTLDRLGARLRGNLVFEVPAGSTLDVRFYDFAHGHMSLVLREGPRAAEPPLVASAGNEILEAAVYRVEKSQEKSPEGMAWLRVDLRARSLMATESDATAFDPKAKPGEKIRVGTVSDWTEVRKHLHVLVDGEFAHGTAEPPEFGDAPRFLPDVPTGGRAAFLIPAKSQSVELRCDFPNARLPDGSVVHPKALTFLLEGKRPEAATAAPIAEIDDEVFKVSVTAQAVAAEFAGTKPPAGTLFLVLDVTVTGAGRAGELFRTSEQIRYLGEKGQQVAMHEAAFQGPRAPLKLLLVPTGERRSFQTVFAIPSSDRRPRLGYRGVSKAATVELKPVEPAVRACPQCKAPAAAADRFCGGCGTKLGP
jgi:hypothetical protein